MVSIRMIPLLLAGLVTAKEYAKAQVFKGENYQGEVQKVAFNKGCASLDFRAQSFLIPEESEGSCTAYTDDGCSFGRIAGIWNKNITSVDETVRSLQCVVF